MRHRVLVPAHLLDDGTEVRSQDVVHLFQLSVHIGELKYKQTKENLIYTHTHIYLSTLPFKSLGSPRQFRDTFIYQINCKMNRKYRQNIDEVRNNDFYFKY